MQKRSYEDFLQKDADSERRAEKGLQAALMSVFPISDYNNTALLEFTSYSLRDTQVRCARMFRAGDDVGCSDEAAHSFGGV